MIRNVYVGISRFSATGKTKSGTSYNVNFNWNQLRCTQTCMYIEPPNNRHDQIWDMHKWKIQLENILFRIWYSLWASILVLFWHFAMIWNHLNCEHLMECHLRDIINCVNSTWREANERYRERERERGQKIAKMQKKNQPELFRFQFLFCCIFIWHFFPCGSYLPLIISFFLLCIRWLDKRFSFWGFFLLLFFARFSI